MATPELAASEARIRELEAQLAARLAAPTLPAQSQRLKFPTPDKFYGGTSEPTALNWCDQVDAYLTALNHFDTVEGVATASAYLHGQARTWLRFIKAEAAAGRGVTIAGWPDLRSRLLAKFTPTNYKQVAMDKLSALAQTKSVRAYSQRFQELMLEIGTSMTEESFVLNYLKNLKPAVSVQVRLQQPKTVELAMLLAETADDAIWQATKSDRQATKQPFQQHQRNRSGNGAGRNTGNNQRNNPSNGPQPMELGAATALTDEERAQLMAEGKCFKCRQRGHRSRTCPSRQGSSARTAAVQEN